MKILLGEIKKIIRRKQFTIITILLFLAVFIDFYITANYYNEKPLTCVPSAYECTLLSNLVKTPVTVLLGDLLALVVSIIASDIYFEEKKMGINNMLFTRIKKKTSILYKVFGISIIVFFIVFLSLSINLLLCVNTFPLQGNFTDLTTFKELIPADTTRVLSFLENFYPYLNILVFIVIRSLFAVISAIFAFSISFIEKINKYIVLLSSLLFYFVFTVLQHSIFSSETMTTNILAVNGYGNIWIIFAFLAIEFIISLFLLYNGCRKDTL